MAGGNKGRLGYNESKVEGERLGRKRRKVEGKAQSRNRRGILRNFQVGEGQESLDSVRVQKVMATENSTAKGKTEKIQSELGDRDVEEDEEEREREVGR